MEDATNFDWGVRAVIDGDESVQGGYEKVAMNELEMVDGVLGLVLGGADFNEGSDVEVG